MQWNVIFGSSTAQETVKSRLVNNAVRIGSFGSSGLRPMRDAMSFSAGRIFKVDSDVIAWSFKLSKHFGQAGCHFKWFTSLFIVPIRVFNTEPHSEHFTASSLWSKTFQMMPLHATSGHATWCRWYMQMVLPGSDTNQHVCFPV